MKIVAQLSVWNEVAKGNLEQCLENIKRWADDVVIYDDGSIDGSVEVASRYTEHIIRGPVHENVRGLTPGYGDEAHDRDCQAHKQAILERSIELGADWLMWLDCDEILSREGTAGGLRRLAENAPPEVDAYSFHEYQLWRSRTYRRFDGMWDRSWFCRLWRVVPGLRFDIKPEPHGRLFPITIQRVEQAPFPVIHYGHAEYHRMLVKQCCDHLSRHELHKLARTHWMLDERACRCVRVPNEVFPEENVPPDSWPEPRSRTIESLVAFSELPSELQMDARRAFCLERGNP